MKVPPYPSPMAGLLYSVNSEVPRRKEDREGRAGGGTFMV
eukprot:CAMPEP_0118920114 /NCGR_PEP_ID=MMETSP1166-20130328/18889_1 /TAXON_ID=1104430 /ORGANISM="Chrysoreinhardia sp, Strain CCMP3193" /LENGTH=39 /DNA_ID= /DNA_START= /DNA_END= /DNA_ORIENTATION=